MANEVKNALDALAARLADVPNLRVARDGETDGWSDFPLATLRLSSRTAAQTALAGASFEGEIIIEIAVAGETAADLIPFIEPQGAMSVEAAISADTALAGAVDYARLVEVSGAGVREIGGRRRMAAEFRVRFGKRVGG